MADFDPSAITARIRVLQKQAIAGADRGLRLGAEHLLGAAQKIVPIEEGTLGRSGKVSTEGHTAAVSFSTPYAVVQHEDLSFKHDPGRTAKYLETPMNTETDVIAQLVRAEVRTEMG